MRKRTAALYCAYYVLQCTWGIVQNLVGLAVFLCDLRAKHYLFHGAVVTVWNCSKGNVALGMFIFVNEPADGRARLAEYESTRIHEFGHTIQSIILGPLYLLVIGLPSGLWCALPVCRGYRERHGVSYYRFYPERWANYLGEKITKGKVLC